MAREGHQTFMEKAANIKLVKIKIKKNSPLQQQHMQHQNQLQQGQWRQQRAQLVRPRLLQLQPRLQRRRRCLALMARRRSPLLLQRALTRGMTWWLEFPNVITMFRPQHAPPPACRL